MFSSEIKEVVYIAVSLMLLSLVLGLMGFLIGVRNDLATIRNNEVMSAHVLRVYREFNRFNNRTVFGEDVIEAIRYYFDSDIAISVNNSGGGVLNYFITRDIARTTPHLVGMTHLRTHFPVNARFTAILVYDGVDPRTVSVSQEATKRSSDVTGIRFINTGVR